MLGRAKKVIIEKEKTTIATAPASARTSRRGSARSRRRSRDHLDYDREKLQERLAKLAGVSR